MESQVSALKAEIKKWEKDFKLSNGVGPTVADIRAQPEIASKYKLYKRLSNRASTPPTHSILLPSSSRLPLSTAPLATFNPFSPVKNKNKSRLPSHVSPSSPSNSFSTPIKSSIEPPPIPSPSPAPHSAVSRARKRLRGDPVSPSPNKEKRQRVMSYPKLPAPSLIVESSSIHSSDHQMNNVHPHNTSSSMFVDNTPMKRPPGNNKSFKVLFDETLPKLALDSKKGHDAAANLKVSPPSLEQHVPSLPSFDEEFSWVADDRDKLASRSTSLITEKAFTSKHEDFRSSNKASKRSLSDIESDSLDAAPKSRFPHLIPPSPSPEATSLNTFLNKGYPKGKSAAINVRKKAKLNNIGSGDESSEDADNQPQPVVKIINHTAARFRQAAQQGDKDSDDSYDFDPDLVLAYVHRPRAQGSPHGNHSLWTKPSIRSNSAIERSGKLEIDLPDRLKGVLALDDINIEAREKQEERMVERLLYNRRTTHYDPSKGGEIWGPGEDATFTKIGWDFEEEVHPDTEGEDEWEGEPVSWDIAEL
ncbi:hypothetical protein AMATHDRAFT_367 [Amanita thiersii Skay4041]|uniref:DNA replication regulator SLD2 n=1 Tax=Amanita thiersii Skay4041 TaxID=703135 RepID=A0A2A9NX86_9AGAR|nr:hypothetical protein AMATHDRAFT_367 [Amanita thiersii Skay4041]